MVHTKDDVWVVISGNLLSSLDRKHFVSRRNIICKAQKATGHCKLAGTIIVWLNGFKQEMDKEWLERGLKR